MSDSYLWWRDGVIYQIYPRSFYDSNGDGIGDLPGITARLDYLADLGVDGLWISPIYPSPDVDFGYDVSNYKDIDPKFGSMRDFEDLVAAARQRGMRIILDLVLAHTSDQHPWFVEARQSRENERRDWYIWRDPKPGGGRPNNWESIFGGPAWEFDPLTGQYYYHMFYKQQPDLNWRNPAVRAEMMDVFRFWADKGVSGFRLDVFNNYLKDAQFRDNPPRFGLRGFDRQHHIYDTNQPEMIGVVQQIRRLVDAYPESYVVGETFMNQEWAADYVGEDKLHAAFNFEMLGSPFSARKYFRAIQRWESGLAETAWPNYVLNNHDNPRTATRFGRGERDERLKVAAAMLLTLRGTPFIYYGEEIGMRDIRITRKMIQDPIGKRYWPFHKGRDGCRAPMQWSSGPQAGFTGGTPWLPVHPDYLWRNVERQLADPDSLLNFYKRLLRLRRQTPALQRGMFQALTFDPRSLLAYQRQTSDQTVLVALNFSRRPLRLYLGPATTRGEWALLLSSHRQEPPDLTQGVLPLAGYEVCILAKAG